MGLSNGPEVKEIQAMKPMTRARIEMGIPTQNHIVPTFSGRKIL
jgi:hypothetical protein